VANVSLRQIRLAAGQGNEAAVRYHLGDKNGIIEALTQRHSPRMQAIQDRIMGDSRRPHSRRRLVEALVLPIAEYTRLGPSERAWIKILAELLTDPQLSLDTIQEHSTEQATAVGVELLERLSSTIHADLAAERIWAVAQFAIHISADRARLLDDTAAARKLTSDQVFATNLVDMALGALTAPVTSS